MSDVHNVFISHRHEDDALVSDLKTLLAGRNVAIRDSSITSETPNNANNEAYIKSEILAPNINWAGKVIVIITPVSRFRNLAQFRGWESWVWRSGRRLGGTSSRGLRGVGGC